MIKVLDNPMFHISVCVLFAIALVVNGFAGGTIPGFVNRVQIAHGPTFPPDPFVAHGPTFPPDPFRA